MRVDDAHGLLAVAHRATGLAGECGEPVEEALSALLSSLRQEARLSAIGRIATRRDLVGKLSNLLILDDVDSGDRSIRQRPIISPVFVTGLPRSGTSFLHGLLASQASVQVPLAWQMAYPAPAHPAAGRRTARWRATASHDNCGYSAGWRPS